MSMSRTSPSTRERIVAMARSALARTTNAAVDGRGPSEGTFSSGTGGNKGYVLPADGYVLTGVGIGVAGGFVHVDIRVTDTPVMWTYS